MSFNKNLQKFTKNDKFLMLALDHRQSFEKVLPRGVNPSTVKKEIIDAHYSQMSALLVDQNYGLPAYLSTQHEKPFLLPVEKSGYSDEGGERVTQLKYDVEHVIAAGASGVKLLIYFNPDAKTARRQIETARKVMEAAKQANFPFFLEVVTYNHAENEYLIVRSLEMLVSAGILPDVYKLEYPGSPEDCKRVTKMLGDLPWILLTKGDDFSVFDKHLEIAKSAGCSGFLAGRSLWQEGIKMESKDERTKFFNTVAKDRFDTISKVMIG